MNKNRIKVFLGAAIEELDKGESMKEIKPIPQNHPALPEAVRLYGCRYRTLQAIAEFIAGATLSLRYITNAYNTFKREKDVMNSNCECGEKEFKIIQDAYTELTLEKRVLWQIGKIEGDKVTYWSGTPHPYTHIIREYKTNVGKHFVLLDKDKNLIFDPWSLEYNAPLNTSDITNEYIYGIK